MKSSCMDIVNKMAQEDQDTLLEKLEQYQAMGIPPEKAQRMAASDTLEEIRAESAEFLRLVAEQHPDPVTEQDQVIPSKIEIPNDLSYINRITQGAPILSNEWKKELRDGWMRDSSVSVPISLLSTTKDAFANSVADIKNKKPSKTNAPIDVWLQSDGRLLIADGQHRYAQAVLDGVKEVEVSLLGEGYSDYYQEVTALNGVSVESDGGVVSRSERAPMDFFFSELVRQVEAASMLQAPVESWKSFIKSLSQKGVKADEVEWSGVNDWLDLQEGKVTRKAIAEYLQGNGVQVSEVVLQDANTRASKYENQLYEWATTEEDSGKRTDLTNAVLSGFSSSETLRIAKQERAPDAVMQMAQNLQSARNNKNNTKYENYVLPGGSNYREVLVTLPVALELPPVMQMEKRLAVLGEMEDDYKSEGLDELAEKTRARIVALEKTIADSRRQKQKGSYTSSHWDEKNVLAHLRLNDRTDADGGRVLFVEEIQSDWGQDGKKLGFDTKLVKVVRKSGLWGTEYQGDFVASVSEENARNAARDLNIIKGGSVPVAPFVTKTDGWLNLALKRVISLAVDGGYDKVAFVNGAQSAERYDLSKQVDKLIWFPDGKGRGDLQAFKDRDELIFKKDISQEDLPDLIGKESADRLLNKPTEKIPGRNVENHALSGVDLKVGGSGMIAFYDNIVLNAVKALLKKVGGGQMESVVGMISDKAAWSITPPTQTVSGKWMLKSSDYNTKGLQFDTEAEARAELAVRQNKLIQPGFSITSAMREKVAGGMPMFSERAQQDVLTEESQASKINTITQGQNDNFYTELRKRLGSGGSGNYPGPLLDAALLGLERPGVHPRQAVERHDHGRWDGSTIFRWTDKTSLKDYYTTGFKTHSPDGVRGFYMPIVAARYIQGTPTNQEMLSASWDGRSASVVEIHDRPDGAVDLAIRGPRPGGAFHLENAADIEATGLFSADGEYLRLPVGPSVAKSWIREALRRYAMLHGGSLPDVVMARATGANPSDMERSKPGREMEMRYSERQTETPQFKKWFKDSKVVDKEGQPLEVFHGSVNKGVEVFDTTLVTERSRLGDTPGTYFTSKREAAVQYARKMGSKTFGEVVSAYLSIQNPLDTTADIKRLRKSGLSFGDAKRKALEKLAPEHDGVIFKGNDMNPPEYVVFKPEQIKSSVNNNGDFDAENPNINYSERVIQEEQDNDKNGNFYTDLRRRLAEHGPDAYSDQELVRAFEGAKQVAGAFYTRGADGGNGRSAAANDGSSTRGAGLVRGFGDVKRMGKLLSRPRGVAGHSAIIRWSNGPDFLSDYVTTGIGVRQGGAPGFLWIAVPANLLSESPTLAEMHQAYMDGNYATAIQASPKGDGDFFIGIPGPRVGSMAFEQLKDHVELTGRLDGDGDGIEYTRLTVGPVVIAEWQREAVRRLAMKNNGVVPGFTFDRETGSNLNRKGARTLPAQAEVRYSMRNSVLDEPGYSIRAGTSAWDAPEPSRFDDMVYKLQNKMLDTKRVIESITKTVGQVADDFNVYLQEELFHGRAAKQVADFGRMELQPLMEHIKRDGYTIGDVEEFLHARHAQEANDVIASREASMPDGGSGMMTMDATAYLMRLSPTQYQKLNGIASKVDAILGKTRQMYATYGLESQQTVDGWEKMFQHYVPLQREDKEGSLGIGQGFSVKGKEVKGRTGSTRKVVDIIANIAMQRERLIVRGEKNRVSQALVGLASANPNPDFWTVGSPPKERVYDPKTNTVVERADPLYKSRDNVLVAKMRTASGDVEEVAVNFNEEDTRALRMVRAMKNMDAGNLEGLLGVSAKITRYFSAINTQYNPIFGVVNLMRDVQGALINLDSTPLANKKGVIVRDTVSALTGIYKDMRTARKNGQPSSAWSSLWDEFQAEGGQTGFRQMFETSQDRAEELQNILTPYGWMNNKWGKIFTANGTLKVPMEKAQDGAAALFNWLSDYNESMENSVRLAAYKAGKDSGMSKQQAASLAKNLTVNFNRKGQIGQQAGAVYAFFNAAMQGTARIGQTLFTMNGGNLQSIKLSNTGKKVVYGGMLLGSLQALALAAAGFDDEDPPDFVRERSFIIPTGGKTYVTIPMPLGFNVIPGLGRMLTEFALDGFKDPAKRGIEVFGMFAGAFNPIGNAGMSIQTLAPTAIDPLVALSENRDYTGKPIARVSSNKALPGHSQYKDTASVFGKLISEGINWSTGGNAYVAGALSPTPDQIDYLISQATGGVGREILKIQQTSLAAVRGEEVATYKIPLLGRFIGDAASQASQSGQFYGNVNRLNELETEVKGMRKDGKIREAADLLRNRPEAYLIQQANVAERQLQRLRREKRALIEQGASREAVKAKELQITQVMMRLNLSMEKIKEAE